MPNDIVLSMRNISKSFPGVRALHNVDFTLNKGEIHALMGENGAGKSTLIKVLTGVYPKDAGEIHMERLRKRSGHQVSARRAKPWHQHRLSGDYTLPEPDRCRKHVYRSRQLSLCQLADYARKDERNPRKTEHTRARDPAAGDVFPRRAADGRYCARRRYGVQGADSRRADLFAR